MNTLETMEIHKENKFPIVWQKEKLWTSFVQNTSVLYLEMTAINISTCVLSIFLNLKIIFNVFFVNRYFH